MVELLLLAGIFAAAWGLWKTLFTSQSPGQVLRKGLSSKVDKKEIALEALSSIWARHKNTEISLEQLAGLWRNRTFRLAPSAAADPVFTHPDIQEFYDRYVKESIFSAAPPGDVIREVLLILDREGDCPSVVSDKSGEGTLEKNTYDMLAGVPLYRHSLDVAEELIKAFKGSEAMLPTVLVTSLGHDIGKLPSYRKTLYSMGDHPLISITVLESLQGYAGLPNKDEISKAIGDHHRAPKGLIGEKLKEADMAARRMELARKVRTQMGGAGTGSDGAEASHSSSSPVVVAVPQTDREEADKESVFISHAKEEKEKISLKEVHLPWFDAEKFLAELKPYINRLDGARWGAFSMPDGHVYFQAGVLEEAARKLGKGDPDISLMSADRDLKRNILYTIVCILRREKDAIARGLIKEGYFGGPFIARMKDGRELSFYYTPFNAEAFGETVSYFESLKERKIKEIEDVQPKIQR